MSARFIAKVNKLGQLHVYDEDFTLDAMLRITGDWPSDEIKLRYGQQVAAALNAMPPHVPTREEIDAASPPPSSEKP